MVNFSIRETFPGIFIEGLLSGLPILTTWRPIKQKYYGDFVYVVNNGPKEMLEIVFSYYEKWKSNKEEYFAFKRKISSDALNYFNSTEMVDKFQKELEDLVYGK